MVSFREVFDMQETGGGVTQHQIIQALMAECIEALDETKWKWWKDYSTVDIKTDDMKKEISDIFIFAILLAKSTGMSAQDLVDVIYSKSCYNKERSDHKKYSEVEL